jgi:hypothetical protein
MMKYLALAAMTAMAFGTIERVAPSTAQAQAKCHSNCDAKYPPGRSQANVQCKAKCKS